jgi:hypothetical protein
MLGDRNNFLKDTPRDGRLKVNDAAFNFWKAHDLTDQIVQMLTGGGDILQSFGLFFQGFPTDVKPKKFRKTDDGVQWRA